MKSSQLINNHAITHMTQKFILETPMGETNYSGGFFFLDPGEEEYRRNTMRFRETTSELEGAKP